GDTTPVQGNAGETGVPLPAPRLVCGELLPVRAVESRSCPCRIVSRMKLPGTAERDSPLTETFDDDGGRYSPCAHLHRMQPRGCEGKHRNSGNAGQVQDARRHTPSI